MDKYGRHLYQVFDYANYAHIFLYAFYRKFEGVMRESEKVGRIDYLLNAEVNGNVVYWQLKTDDEEISEVFSSLMEKCKFNDKEIENAAENVSLSIGRKVKITDLAKLKEEIQNRKESKTVLEPTDDSLHSPAVDYNERRNPDIVNVNFELGAKNKNAETILDYYISAVAQQLSDIWPKLLVRAENDKSEIVILSKNNQIDIDDGIDMAIGQLKKVGFDEKLATFLKIDVSEVCEILPTIVISAQQ